MKKLALLFFICIFISSCSSDNDDNLNVTPNAEVTLNFTHNWDNTAVTSSGFNTLQYINENGETLSIVRLRYLISNVSFQKTGEEPITINDFNLVDLTNSEGLNYSPETQLTPGNYTVSFTFGFNNDDNSQNHIALNSASWNVPEMLGGGYHFMQFDGNYLNNADVETGFNYHTIRAVDASNAPDLLFQDTFFTVNLGEITIPSNTTIEVKMNIAEWFKNPNTWNLNTLDTMLMPNFNAQVLMNQNGQSVFSLGTVTQ